MASSGTSSHEEAETLLEKGANMVSKDELAVENDTYDDHPHLTRFLEALKQRRQGLNTSHLVHTVFNLARHALYSLIPTFLRKTQSQTHDSKKARRYAHLDGMRGLAALFVFFFHSSYTIWEVRPGYLSGDEPESPYTSILRLPFLRLLYSGDAMVSIFFVISGFVLSVKPIKLMDSGSTEALFNTISSSAFRRAIRLYAPCLAATFIIMLAVRLGAYEGTRAFAENADGMLPVSQEWHMWRAGSFKDQLVNWVKESFNLVHVWEWEDIYEGNTSYDVHLWTIPTEFRCSMVLFVTQFTIAPASQIVRILSLVGLTVFATLWGRWDMLCFWSGAILAELDARLVDSNQHNDEGFWARQPPTRRLVAKVVCYSSFVFALYLLSFPEHNAWSTYGYMTLSSWVPVTFSQHDRFWQVVGATIAACCINNSSVLQKFFASRPVRYLGNISFSMYLMHGLMIHTLGYTLLPFFWSLTSRDNGVSIAVGWLLSQIFVTAALIAVSDVFWINVDVPCTQLSRWLEKVYKKSSH